jgi:hypothetical protein
MLVERGLFAQATSARRPHTFPKAKARHTTAPRCYVEAGDATAVQHDKPVTALLRRAEVGRLDTDTDTDAALELLTAQSAIASSSNAMRIRSHIGKSAVIA